MRIDPQMAAVVYAAARVAKTLHQGQKDKGGKDYFTSHLLQVGKSGDTWKSQIVGFLHDAEEDTGHDVDTVLSMVKDQLREWSQHPDDTSWSDDFNLFDIPRFHDVVYFFPSEHDWQEIAEALRLLNHHTAKNREEYINRFGSNKLALHVKLNDMQNNMDISRIPNPTPDDYKRLERYRKEFGLLKQMLANAME